MKKDQNKRFFSGCRLLMLCGCVAIRVVSSTPPAPGGELEKNVADFSGFDRAIERSDLDQAILIGDKIFKGLKDKYGNKVGFGVFCSKLRAAEFLAQRMVSELEKATRRRPVGAAHELFSEEQANQILSRPNVATARSFYEATVNLFAKDVNTDALEQRDKNFLAGYYDLKLNKFVASVAKAGRALAIAEPDFKGTYDYVLLLPLLHASDKTGINLDLLPDWLARSGQLDELSDSCLLHFRECFFAMMLSKKSAQKQGRPFCEVDFYRSAAAKARQSNPRIAAECLNRAIDCVEPGDLDAKIDLHLDLVQLWMDSENYALAAAEARKIVAHFSNQKDWAKGVWLYYYGLSRCNNVDAILRQIDARLDDKRCAEYRAKLLYIKWWALRRKPTQDAKLAAVENQLLTDYGDTEIAAPVMLSRAADHLARQENEWAAQLLTELVQKFPGAKAAVKAANLLEKLETTHVVATKAPGHREN